MTKITADQINALYGEFDDKGRKKLKLGDTAGYRKLQKGEIQDLTNDQLKDMFLQYSQVSDDFTNELIKEDITDIFSDQNSIASLRQMLIDNQGDVNHILTGYKKLAKVKKLEREIDKLEGEINDIKLKLYIEKKSLQTAHRTIIARVQKIQKQIEQKKSEKEKLLQTKEVVAAYELQKITGYANRLNNEKLVYTPSVQKNKEEVRDSVFTGQNILLTGPVGTGKTRLAIDIYKEILEEKKKNGEIDDAAYQKLSQLCVVGGNEDTSIRELKSRPVQMSNKEGEENVFTYDEGLLTLCLKYGMPLIVDEANRTSPNFLSSLKKFRAFKSGQEYKDEVTGETFKIKAPLQVILTSNEGQKYGKHTTEFQDQIERELERVYVGYMPENELYDLAKAKLYETPGIANVTERDLQETLPHLINAVTEINDLYTSGKEYSSADSTSDMKLSSTVLDTKRFLQLIDREIIGSKETFWDELNQKIVEFIQGIKPSDAGDMDRKILCIIFHKNGLLCKENIPDLVKGADNLTAHDLSTIVSSTKSQLKIPTGNRFVNPWQFAKGYGDLINREGDVARHRLANFENLDFEDSGTKLKTIAKSLRELGVLNPMNDGELISKLNKLDENNLESVLNDVADVVLSKDQPKIGKFGKILEDADGIMPGISDKIFDKLGNANFEETVFEDVSDEAEISGEIPQDLEDFRKKWEEKIEGIDDESKEKIIKAAETIPVKVETESDGSRLVEFKLGNKRYKILDPKLKAHSDDEYFNDDGYTFIQERNEWVKLRGMRGDDVNQRENKKLAKYVKEKEREGLHIAKIEEMKAILTEIGESAGLDGESDQIAMLMYLTGMDGLYWLSMGDSETSGSQNSRSSLRCYDHFRWFYYLNDDYLSASLCMIACK